MFLSSLSPFASSPREGKTVMDASAKAKQRSQPKEERKEGRKEPLARSPSGANSQIFLQRRTRGSPVWYPTGTLLRQSAPIQRQIRNALSQNLSDGDEGMSVWVNRYKDGSTSLQCDSIAFRKLCQLHSEPSRSEK